MSTSQAAATVSVEYAKSGRSTCKGCSAAIASGALRLGASARDPRGFDSTKWYHVACFPASSHPLGPIEGITGFDAIKDDDREELRQLEKNCKRGNAAVGPLDEPSPKKVRRVAEKTIVSVEYAKSGRSTCKGCSENIAKGALRLGASAHDPRGFDSTKWYHVACFPTSSYPVSCVENLKGIDSIKTEDHEKLRELEEKQKGDGNVADQLNEPNQNKEMVDNMGDSKEDGEKSLEEAKLSARNKETGPLVSFSASDVKDKYKDATLPAHWKVFDTVIFREKEDGLHASAKIAAFDFDGCLAKTSVRRSGADEWSLMHKSIPVKLQKLYYDGYKLVIFTNESNIERWKNKRQVAVDSKVGRLDQFVERVKVPIQVFIACGLGKGKGTPDDQYRKPNPGMWWLMAQHFNSGIKIDMDQ
ncbi:hypothetical protein PR202_ga09751 [Eleusine coracana subsp. coracana]|uniref:PARP-type domain-containing protein n=1 Tax=Eleusine coracana subsp. coracana TaxID=191504 RepID=A0AAV5C5A9_ELECO|nr:hypothetical protein PR202_ga09751 [Eleusine coracana subsp. coracana]